MQTAANGAPASGFSILVVDDNTQLLEMIALRLAREGFRVWTAESGDQAKAMFDRGMVPDLLLTDATMPGELQGPDLVEYAKRLRPRMPTVLMSAYLDTGKVNSKGIISADLAISKPFDLRDLVSKLLELLRTDITG